MDTNRIIKAAMNAARRYGISACYDEQGNAVLCTIDMKSSQALNDFLSLYKFDIRAAWLELVDVRNWSSGSCVYSAKADAAIRKGLIQ